MPSIRQWRQESPVIDDLLDYRETLWLNPGNHGAERAVGHCSLSIGDVLDASERLQRFTPYIALTFPETQPNRGIIESPICEISRMQRFLENSGGMRIPGRLLLKLDSHLPISGSIKARGGIYEVLKFAETLAIQQGLLGYQDNYAVIRNDRFRQFFSRYSIAVGSTGNLGLSIGIMGAALGFRVTVHMSADARPWKKQLLRSKGVAVIEYEADYSRAVTEGRKQALLDPHCHFVDDENAKDLFLGYAVAALRLKQQLQDLNIKTDQQHPLFVYLPCGVGGAPSGITFGLKLVYGDAVHCFFAEPTHAPCFLLGLVTGCFDAVSVQDFGIDQITCADGLAVGRASHFAGKLIGPFVNGCYTVSDARLYYLLNQLAATEAVQLEPSALAGLSGPWMLTGSPAGRAYLESHVADGALANAVHLCWTTGGSMVPAFEMAAYRQKGAQISPELFSKIL